MNAIDKEKLKLLNKLKGKEVVRSAKWLKENAFYIYDNLKNDTELIKNDDVILIKFKLNESKCFIIENDCLKYIGSVYTDYDINTIKKYIESI
jgi:hypothetical protein